MTTAKKKPEITLQRNDQGQIYSPVRGKWLFEAKGGGGNINVLQDTVAGCGAKITYDYKPVAVAVVVPPPSGNVPEPGSLALMGLALAGVGLVRRKKK